MRFGSTVKAPPRVKKRTLAHGDDKEGGRIREAIEVLNYVTGSTSPDRREVSARHYARRATCENTNLAYNETASISTVGAADVAHIRAPELAPELIRLYLANCCALDDNAAAISVVTIEPCMSCLARHY